MDKELRILTGFHAGARIKLNPTTMSIGKDTTADILIQDWSEGTMQLAIDAEDRVTIVAADAADTPSTLDDFAPRRFGDVVLCAGPDEAQWPSDLQLLEAMLAAPAGADDAAEVNADEPVMMGDMRPMPPARRASWTRTGLVAMLVGSAGAGALALTMGGASQAATRPPAPVGLADVRRALERLQEPGIELREQANGFVASGIVANGEAARRAHAGLRSVAGNRLRWQVKPADDIARELAESLHEPHVLVRYAGAGRFEVTGTARQPGAVRDVAERFRNDMAAPAPRIDVKVERIDELGIAGKVDSAVNADGVRYIESSDGTKNFLADASGNTTLH
jgi:type III secretion protein D